MAGGIHFDGDCRTIVNLWQQTRKQALNKVWPGRLNTGWFVPVEVRIVAGKDEAFQSFGLEEQFAGHPLSFDPEIYEPVNGNNNTAMHHLVASRILDFTGTIREQIAGRFDGMQTATNQNTGVGSCAQMSSPKLRRYSMVAQFDIFDR